MKKIDELIDKLNENTDYEELLCEITKSSNNNSIKNSLEYIHKNKNLNQKQKKEIYNNLFNYVTEINNNLKNKIENIHKRGFKEGTLMTLILDIKSKKELNKRDIFLETVLQDFIINRLRDKSTLDDNSDYIENKNKVNTIKEKLNKETLRVIEELEDLYANKEDLSIIESYKIGFSDAIKLFYNTTNEQ